MRMDLLYCFLLVLLCFMSYSNSLLTGEFPEGTLYNVWYSNTAAKGQLPTLGLDIKVDGLEFVTTPGGQGTFMTVSPASFFSPAQAFFHKTKDTKIINAAAFPKLIWDVEANNAKDHILLWVEKPGPNNFNQQFGFSDGKAFCECGGGANKRLLKVNEANELIATPKTDKSADVAEFQKLPIIVYFYNPKHNVYLDSSGICKEWSENDKLSKQWIFIAAKLDKPEYFEIASWGDKGRKTLDIRGSPNGDAIDVYGQRHGGDNQLFVYDIDKKRIYNALNSKKEARAITIDPQSKSLKPLPLLPTDLNQEWVLYRLDHTGPKPPSPPVGPPMTGNETPKVPKTEGEEMMCTE